MSISPQIEHGDYKGTIYSTSFIGERDALGRSDFLRPLLPPTDRKYTSFDSAVINDEIVAHRINSCHRKHGGIRVLVIWGPRFGHDDARILSREEIIDLSRRIFADIREQSQDRINSAPAGWPFPIWRVAA